MGEGSGVQGARVRVHGPWSLTSKLAARTFPSASKSRNLDASFNVERAASPSEGLAALLAMILAGEALEVQWLQQVGLYTRTDCLRTKHRNSNEAAGLGSRLWATP